MVPDAELRTAALAYCARLATRSRAGLAAMKSLARTGAELPLAQALALEARDAEVAMRATDVDEGLDAFKNRRDPHFP